MPDATILLSASPREGNGTFLARRLVSRALFPIQHICLSSYGVRPCIACGLCATQPGHCRFDGFPDDDGQKLLSLLYRAPAIIIMAPVYFYGPPAQLKALIDRSQVVWEARRRASAPPRRRPFAAVLTAARQQGERLFEASELILRCFASALGFSWMEPLCLRGLDAPADAAASPETLATFDSWTDKLAAQIGKAP